MFGMLMVLLIGGAGLLLLDVWDVDGPPHLWVRSRSMFEMLMVLLIGNGTPARSHLPTLHY